MRRSGDESADRRLGGATDDPVLRGALPRANRLPGGLLGANLDQLLRAEGRERLLRGLDDYVKPEELEETLANWHRRIRASLPDWEPTGD